MKIDARGNSVFICGDSIGLSLASNILEQLYGLLQDKYPVYSNDVGYAINAICSDDRIKLKDIFLDTVDLHSYFGRQNHYGPVLFKFSIEFLRELEIDIWITKDNPINWTEEMTNKEKYFSTVTELKKNWNDYQRQ